MKLAVLGDSITAGFNSDDRATEAWPVILAASLGYDLFVDAIPGTGYLSLAGGYSSRTAYILAASPDIVIVQSSWNDLNADIGDLAAAVAAVLSDLSSIEHVYVTSPPNGADLPAPYISPSRVLPLSDIIAPIVATYGRAYVDLQSPLLFTGSGYIGHEQYDGNCDTFISSDGGHPSTACHACLAARLLVALTPPAVLTLPVRHVTHATLVPLL